MASIDSRLVDAKDDARIEEDFNRVLALIDGITGENGLLAALSARLDEIDGEEGSIAALAARVTELEEASGGAGT